MSNFRTLWIRFSLFEPNFRTFLLVYGSLYITIEILIKWAGSQNLTKSEDRSFCTSVQIVLHIRDVCSESSFHFHWSVIEVHGWQLSARWRLRSICLATLFILLTEERYVWEYNGTPMETLHISAWLRMLIWECAESMLFYMFTGLLLNLLRWYMAFTTI